MQKTDLTPHTKSWLKPELLEPPTVSVLRYTHVFASCVLGWAFARVDSHAQVLRNGVGGLGGAGLEEDLGQTVGYVGFCGGFCSAAEGRGEFVRDAVLDVGTGEGG